MIKRLGRFILEPFAKVFRKFFDPRFYKVEYALEQSNRTIDAIADEARAESRVASARDAAFRDGLTLTNTRIGRLESLLTTLAEQVREHKQHEALQQAYFEDAQIKLDTQQTYLENLQTKFDTQHTYLEDLQTKFDTQQTYLEDQQAKFDTQQTHLEDAQRKLDATRRDLGILRPLLEGLPRVLHAPLTTDEIGPVDADLLNFAESHRGFRSQAGLWFNPPDVIRYSEGSVELSAVTERSVEVPFVISAVTSRLAHGAKILDVGCAESFVPLELASLGFAVTGIDLRQYPLAHPNLETFAIPLEEWKSRRKFDAIVCLSSIEHFGLGAYGESATDDEADRKAMNILRKKVKSDGLLVMTIPFGQPSVTDVQRTYDLDRLHRLLEGWSIESIAIAVPADDGWVVLDDVPDAAPPTDPPVTTQVALIIAHPDG